MSLRNRLRLTSIALVLVWAVVWAVVWFHHPDSSGWKWELLSALLVIVIGVGASNILARRSLRLFRSALAIADIPTARREHANLADFWRRRGRETIKAFRINIMLLEEQYEDALKELQELDRRKLPKNAIPVIENQTAWCQMNLGKPDKGMQIAQSVLPQLESLGPDYGSSGHLVLGTANFLLSKPYEAMLHLEKTYLCSAHLPAMRATAAFYLGECFSALGKLEEARKAYRDAELALPNSKFAARASERLKMVP
jgi:tetratricopeptide (TPR) repeat protein